MAAPASRRETIAALKIAVAPAGDETRAVIPFGVKALDERLAHHGLVAEALHEVAPVSAALSDDAAATLFAAGIAARLAADRKAPAFWALSRYDLYAPGLHQAGLAPDQLIHAEVARDRDLLALVEDAARDGAFSAVIGEVRQASMTALRRLQLAAEEGGIAVMLLRRWRRPATCPLSEPSVATTRWRIGSVPSGSLGVPGVGRARWSVELVRQRGGHPFSTIVEGCDATGRLALPADVRDRATEADGASIQRAA
jgi:protein ImuA